MIARANILLSKFESVRETETNQLERMTARSIQVQQLETAKRLALEQVQFCLAEVVVLGEKELKSQAVFRAEGNKINKLSTLQAKHKSYEKNLM